MTSHRFIYEELKREKTTYFFPERLQKFLESPSGIFWILERMREKDLLEDFVDSDETYELGSVYKEKDKILGIEIDVDLLLNPPLFLSKVEAFLRERKG